MLFYYYLNIEAETVRRIHDVEELYKAAGLENPNNMGLAKVKHNIKKLQQEVLAKSEAAKEEVEDSKDKLLIVDHKVTPGAFNLAVGLFSSKAKAKK